MTSQKSIINPIYLNLIPLYLKSNQGHPSLIEHIWVSLSLTEPIRSYPSLSEPIRDYPSLSEPIQSYPILFERIRAYPCLSVPIWAYPSLSEPIWVEPIRAGPSRSEPFRVYPSRSESIRVNLSIFRTCFPSITTTTIATKRLLRPRKTRFARSKISQYKWELFFGSVSRSKLDDITHLSWASGVVVLSISVKSSSLGLILRSETLSIEYSSEFSTFEVVLSEDEFSSSWSWSKKVIF